MKHPHDNIRVGAITFVYPLQSEAGYFRPSVIEIR